MHFFRPQFDPDWQRIPPASLPAYGIQVLSPPPPSGPLLFRQFRFPASLASGPQRLVYLADLHWDTHDETRLRQVTDAINAVAADWVLFGGDLVSDLEALPCARAVLSRITARRGKLAVLGNWERKYSWLPLGFWQQFYDGTGFELLVNDVRFAPTPHTLAFVGYDEVRWSRPDLACGAEARDSGRFTVGLTHSPQLVGKTTGQFLGHLVLAGHTHGGQWRLPGIGAIYTSTPYWRKFDWGWFRRPHDGAWLYVTAGVGLTGIGIFRRRVLCPPELLILDLV